MGEAATAEAVPESAREDEPVGEATSTEAVLAATGNEHVGENTATESVLVATIGNELEGKTVAEEAVSVVAIEEDEPSDATSVEEGMTSNELTASEV